MRVPAGQRPQSRTRSGCQLHADWRHHPARRNRIRDRRVARHRALVPSGWSAAGSHCRLLRAGKDCLGTGRAAQRVRGKGTRESGVLARNGQRGLGGASRCAVRRGSVARHARSARGRQRHLGHDRADLQNESGAADRGDDQRRSRASCCFSARTLGWPWACLASGRYRSSSALPATSSCCTLIEALLLKRLFV